MRRKLEKEDHIEDGVIDMNNAQEPSDLRGDEKNIAILFFLYLLQGIPLGLCGSIPMLLQNRGVSYRQQVRIYHLFTVSLPKMCDLTYFLLHQFFVILFTSSYVACVKKSNIYSDNCDI